MGLCQPCGANDEIRDEGRMPYVCREAAHPRGSFACPFASVLEVNALLKTSSGGCRVQNERGVRNPMYSGREETQYAAAFVPQHRKRAINALSWAKAPPWYPHQPKRILLNLEIAWFLKPHRCAFRDQTRPVARVVFLWVWKGSRGTTGSSRAANGSEQAPGPCSALEGAGLSAAAARSGGHVCPRCEGDRRR
jgi:hypothetical protein